MRLSLKSRYTSGRLHPCIFLVAVCVLVYLNALDSGFLSDDIPAIVRNHLLFRPARFWHDPAQLLNSMNRLAAGEVPFVYHLTNLILHCINTVLVYYFLSTLFRGATAVLLGSLLFAVHPVHAEAVVWVSGRPYLVIAMFILANYLLYRKAAVNGFRGRFFLAYLLSVLFFLYDSVRTYGFYYFFPLFLPLADFVEGEWRRRWKFWLPFFAIAACKALLVKVALAGRVIALAEQGGGVPAWNNPLFSAAHSFFSNLAILLWPVRLTLYHEVSSPPLPLVISETVFFLLLLASLPFVFRKAKEMFLAIALFALFLLPTYSPLAVCCMVAERYLYFPLVALSIAVAYFWDRCVKAPGRFRSAVILLSVAVLSLYALRTMRRNEDWQDEKRFWQSALASSPQSSRVLAKIGDIYRQEGRLGEAVQAFKKAIALNSREAAAYNNLGVTHAQMGKDEEALQDYRKAIELKPDFSEAYFNLGNLYAAQGNTAEALASFSKAVEIDPWFAEAYLNMGAVCAGKGAWPEAIVAYKNALQAHPRFAVAHNNLAVAYYYYGEYGLAETHCRKARELGYPVNRQFISLLEERLRAGGKR